MNGPPLIRLTLKPLAGSGRADRLAITFSPRGLHTPAQAFGWRLLTTNVPAWDKMSPASRTRTRCLFSAV